MTKRTNEEWKHDMEAFLDGIESELRPTSVRAQAILRAFRDRIDHDSIGPRRKRFERELESNLQTDPFLKRATERYFSKKVPAALASARETLDRAERVLKQLDKSKKPLIN